MGAFGASYRYLQLPALRPYCRCQHCISDGAYCGAAIDAVIAEYPWSRYSRFVDIAGAYGSFLARLLNHVKAAEGVIFDQPQARAHSTCRGSAARIGEA